MAKYKAKASKGAVTFVGVLAVLTAATLVVGILSNWFTQFWIWNKNKPTVNDDKNDVVAVAPASNMSIEQTESSGIMLLSAPMALSDFEAYDVSPYADSVQTVTATLSPSDTTLQKVDFTVAWENANSPWATGKDVTDYIQLTQATDGALTCAVSALQPFAEQGIITCTARALEEGDYVPSATCTVNFYKRYINSSPIFMGQEYDSDGELYDTYHVTISNGGTLNCVDYYYDGTDDNNFCSVGADYSVGTKFDNVNYTTLKIKVTIADDITDSIKTAAGITSINEYDFGKFNAYLDRAESSGFKLNTIINQILGGETNVNNHRASVYNAFKTAYDSGRSALKFETTFTTNAGFEYSFINNLKLNPLALGVKASGVGLDKPNVNL